ncbi:hypothetical protein ACQHGV_05680 [Sphingomonas pseudosanguinis]|uniref:hypothetical protein n=1 Tax=Sphingomonas pseudosanguinis TaxID=413712 RepID=UPI003F85DF60
MRNVTICDLPKNLAGWRGATLTLSGVVWGIDEYGYLMSSTKCKANVPLSYPDNKLQTLIEDGQRQGFVVVKAKGRIIINYRWTGPGALPEEPLYVFKIEKLEKSRVVKVGECTEHSCLIDDGKPVNMVYDRNKKSIHNMILDVKLE